jgi:hypothetical protein
MDNKIVNIVDLAIEYEEFKAQYLGAADNVEKATRFWNVFNPRPISLLINRQGIPITLLESLHTFWMIFKQQSIFSMQHSPKI